MGSIDLHSHSQASDGALTPTELVRAAAEHGVRTLALTDHDTLAGIIEAETEATRHAMSLVAGVEISVTWQRRTLHVVGLGVALDATALNAGLDTVQSIRRERAQRIAAKLEKLGVTKALERAQKQAGSGQITRTHFAQLLLESGACKTMQQCFKRYLKAGKPAHVKVDWAALDDAISWIHQAHGVAVLAHPQAYGMSAAWRERMYSAFAAAGGDAVEVCCGNSTRQHIDSSAASTLAHGLMGSVGSDFHSHEQRWLALGRLAPLPNNITPVWQHPNLNAIETATTPSAL